MDWLGEWLRSIILVILLATFVDILLPNQTMQRYVKTVMSLFIMLTLLQPLFSLFQKNVSVDRLLADANTMFSGSPGLGAQQGGAAAMQTLGSIEQQAEQLKSRQAEQSERLVRQQVGDLMQRSIEQSTATKVTGIQVETAKDANGQLQIGKVNVQAAAVPPEKLDKEKSGSVKPMTVEPVKPVTITIAPKSEAVFGGSQDKADKLDMSAGGTKERGSGNQTDPAAAQLQTQIKMLLNKEWQIPVERISVEVAAIDDKMQF
ncbi:stage III sporulation protein AF [Paenibacillus piri]|uniref:Stage III sporulation protein AF n=1 Tax=Paenibacillus piri TaxID=2547395 RepID=A0A4R5KVT8_9BACL|nr:stage III sporulation protein AF [Paenibacillus piri]TDF99235.1 stage III sporulation protein AF [Paenibacillus piri]